MTDGFIGADLLRYNKEQLYLVADGETENLNLVLKNRPWQWSYQIYRGTELLESYDEFLWWADLEVSPDAARVTRFDYNVYKAKAKDPRPILERYESYQNDPKYRIIGANFGNFDTSIHKNWRRELGLPPDYSYFHRILDIQSIEKAIELQIDIPREKNDYLSFLFKMYWYHTRKLKTSVGYLLKKYEIPHDPYRLHEGLYDVGMTKAIFDKQIWLKEV